MKTKKIVGLLLAMCMLISLACPIFADNALTVAADKGTYYFDDTVTITTNKDVRILIKDSASELVLWGAVNPVPVNGSYVYSFKLPSENADAKWKAGTYTITAGGSETATTTFVLAAAPSPTGTPGPTTSPTASPTATPDPSSVDCTIVFKNTSATVKSYTALIDIQGTTSFRNLSSATVDFVVKNNKSEVMTIGEDYKVRFMDTVYNDAVSGTGSQIDANNFYFYFTEKGTYTVQVNVIVNESVIKTLTKSVTVKEASSGGSTGANPGSLPTATPQAAVPSGNPTAKPTQQPAAVYETLTPAEGSDAGIVVKINKTALNNAGMGNDAITYTAKMLDTNKFDLSILVDGKANNSFVGQDVVLVSVPYAASDIKGDLVAIDAAGNVVPRSFYADGKMLMCVNVVNAPYTIEAREKTFKDVDQAWATKQISALAVRNMINGVGDDLFEPNRSVTRAEFVKMVIGMYNVLDTSATTKFSDVAKGDWYYSYVATAADLGITTGYEDGSFGPNDVITREQMSAMLYRAAGALGTKIEKTTAKTVFADDATIQSYAKTPVYEMQQAGVLKGVGDNNFDPAANCTRAQAAVAIYNMFVLSMNK